MREQNSVDNIAPTCRVLKNLVLQLLCIVRLVWFCMTMGNLPRTEQTRDASGVQHDINTQPLQIVQANMHMHTDNACMCTWSSLGCGVFGRGRREGVMIKLRHNRKHKCDFKNLNICNCLFGSFWGGDIGASLIGVAHHTQHSDTTSLTRRPQTISLVTQTTASSPISTTPLLFPV